MGSVIIVMMTNIGYDNLGLSCHSTSNHIDSVVSDGIGSVSGTSSSTSNRSDSVVSGISSSKW